jgi:hypothetical protein
LSLVGTRIDFRERVPGFYGLSFGKSDLSDLPLDLAAHDDGVIGNDGSDTAEIDRDVAAADGAGNDRNGEGFWRRRGGRLPRAPMGQDKHTGDGEDDDNRIRENRSPSSHQPSSVGARS